MLFQAWRARLKLWCPTLLGLLSRKFRAFVAEAEWDPNTATAKVRKKHLRYQKGVKSRSEKWKRSIMLKTCLLNLQRVFCSNEGAPAAASLTPTCFHPNSAQLRHAKLLFSVLWQDSYFCGRNCFCSCGEKSSSWGVRTQLFHVISSLKSKTQTLVS